MPSNVIITTRPTGAVGVNIPEGTYHRLNGAALSVLEALRDTFDFGAALAALEATYPDVSPDQLQAGANQLIHQLVEEGMLATGPGQFSIFKGKPTDGGGSWVAMTRGQYTAEHRRPGDYPAAAIGVIRALAMRRHPFARQVELVRQAHRNYKTATVAEATSLLSAVHRLSAPYLGRVACLELSMATALAAAVRRRRVHVVLGAKSDPDGLHAWPEVQDTPIRAASDPPNEGVYMPIFKI